MQKFSKMRNQQMFILRKRRPSRMPVSTTRVAHLTHQRKGIELQIAPYQGHSDRQRSDLEPQEKSETVT